MDSDNPNDNKMADDNSSPKEDDNQEEVKDSTSQVSEEETQVSEADPTPSEDAGSDDIDNALGTDETDQDSNDNSDSDAETKTQEEPKVEPEADVDSKTETVASDTSPEVETSTPESLEDESAETTSDNQPVDIQKNQVGEVAEAETTESASVEQTVDSLSAAKPKNWRVLGSVGLTLLLVLGIGGYLIFNTISEDETTQTETVKRDIALLRVSVPDGPLNTFYSEVNNVGAVTINNHLYEGLVAYEDVAKIVPLLATSWTNPDDVTWVFDLKQGVLFNNGSEMTAEDVKYSIDNRENVWFGQWGGNISSVEVLDTYKVQITTDVPDPLLLKQLTGLWITDATADEGYDYPVGTGPYTVKFSPEPTETEIYLIANENYHGGSVYTKELVFKQLNTEDAVEAFNNSQIDIVTQLVSDSEKLDLANQKLLSSNTFNVSFLGINSVSPDSPLANLKVRQAIELAIDPELVIAANGVQAEAVNQFVTQDIPGYNTAITRPNKNVQEAITLLKEAGYPDGITVSLTYASASNNGMFDSISSQLAEIGVTVTKDFHGDDNEGFFGAIFGGKAELFFLGYGPDIFDASDTFGVVFSGGEENPYYNNSEIDTLLSQADNTLDNSTRLGILQNIGQVLSDDVAAIPLYNRDIVTALAGPYVINNNSPSNSSGIDFDQVYLP